MGGNKGIPAELYDCAKLFPPLTGVYSRGGGAGEGRNSTSKVQLPDETSRWLQKSAFTTGTVGLFAKFWLTCKSNVFFVLEPEPVAVSVLGFFQGE